ncbi:hypothetical protein D9M71_362510 [compost metagenome]
MGLAGFFLRDDPALAQLLQGAGDDVPVHVDLFLGAVQRGIDVPGPEVLVLLDLLEDGVGGRPGLGGVLGTTGVAGRGFPEYAGDHHGVRDDLGDTQGTDEFDDLGDVGLVLELDLERLEHRRLGHQPEAHLGADAVVGLGEHAVQGRAVAPLEYLPGVVAFHAAHAGPVDVTVGQHHFHAALHQEVFAIRGVADATVHGVAQRTGDGRRGGERQHQRNVVFLQVVVQLLVGHTRFDQRSAQVRIDVEDLVHFLQVENHLAALARCRGAVTEVPPGGDGPDRNPVFVADLHHALHLLDRGGGNGSGRRMFGVVHRHHDLGVGDQLLVLDQDILLAQQRTELADRLLEIGGIHSAREQGILVWLGHLISSFKPRSRTKRKCRSAVTDGWQPAVPVLCERCPAWPACIPGQRPTARRRPCCGWPRIAGGEAGDHAGAAR